MKKVKVHTEQAPAAIGPYSQAVESGNLVFVSGQLPVDPKTGAFPADDVKSQTRQSLNNVKFILQQAGAAMGQVVKTTVYLKDMKDFAQMNEVYAEFFQEPYPARAAVEVACLPKEAAVEIEVIAVK